MQARALSAINLAQLRGWSLNNRTIVQLARIGAPKSDRPGPGPLADMNPGPIKLGVWPCRARCDQAGSWSVILSDGLPPFGDHAPAPLRKHLHETHPTGGIAAEIDPVRIGRID